MIPIHVLPCAGGSPGSIRLVESKGSDLSIVRAARVSYDADWRAGEDGGSDAKLIKYMLKNGHTSPFEHVVFTFEVKAPIFVFRQWHRHRTWSFSEMSARYAELDEGFYVPDPGVIGRQSASSKQARDVSAPSANDNDISRGIIYDACEASFREYRSLLARDVPRELARSVLPVAAYSRMFATVDLHNLMHFLRLRLHPHAQYEIRVYAEAIRHLIREAIPVTMALFDQQLRAENT